MFISVSEVGRLEVDVWIVALVRGSEVEVLTVDDNLVVTLVWGSEAVGKKVVDTWFVM